MHCPVCNNVNPSAATVCQACGTPVGAAQNGDMIDALPVGTMLAGGAFGIIKMLGQGGFGITYLSTDLRLKRTVAIKEFFPFGSRRRDSTVVPPHTLTTDGFDVARTHFLEEACVLARFQHPNIVHVHSAFEENGTVYMVMEFLQGNTLQELVEQQGALPEPIAVDYILKVGDALEAVHKSGLLHRDIKPDNIIVSEDRRVVLFDFGTTRAYTADKTRRMTSIVTPGYAPLEQYGQQARFGPFTDVYALGATLYHLLTGDSPVQATDRVAGVELLSPRQLQPQISQAVSDAVMWSLELKVDSRPQSVHGFLQALRLHSRAPALDRPTDNTLTHVLNRIATARPVDSITDTGRVDDAPNWPQRCACCGDPNDTAMQVVYPRGGAITANTRIWMVPYCSKCKQHVSIDHSGAMLTVLPQLLIGFIMSLVLSARIEEPIFFFLWLFMFVPFMVANTFRRQRLAARRLMKPHCSDVGHAVKCINCHTDMRNHRIYTFQFKNHQYEAEFKAHNGPRLN